MSSPPDHLDANSGREVVFCHNCREEWYRDAHPTLQCPNCESEITEIVEPDNDPRVADLPPDLDDHHHGHHHGHDDSDPDEEDIEDHMYPPRDRFFVRQRIFPGFGPSGERSERGVPPDDGVAIAQRFTEMMMNDFRVGRPERPQAFFSNEGDDPGPRIHRATFRTGPGGFRTSSVTIGFGPAIRHGGANVGSSGPADFDGIFSNLMNSVPSPPHGDDDTNEQPGARRAGPSGGDRLPPQFFTSLQDLLSSLLNPGAAVHGDAVYTQEALDRIITQLMEANPQSNAAPPASEEAIEKLDKKALDDKMIGSDDKVECTICIDELKKGDEVAVLPCKHFFHPECVILWLKEHNTCPICRTPIEKREDNAQSAGNLGGSRNTGPDNEDPNSGHARRDGPPRPTFAMPFHSEAFWNSQAGTNLTSPPLRNSRTPQQNEERLNLIRNLRQSPSSRRNSHSPPSRESGPGSTIRVRSPSLSRDRDLDHDQEQGGYFETPREAARSHWSSHRPSSSRHNSGQDQRQQDGNTGSGDGGSGGSSHGNPISWLRDRISRDRNNGSGGDSSRRRR